MTAEEFNAWLIAMQWTQQQAAKELGVSRNSLSKYLKTGAPKVVALACSTLKERPKVSMSFPIECGVQQGYAIMVAKHGSEDFKLSGQGMDLKLYENTMAWYRRDCPEGMSFRGLFVKYEVEILE